MIKHKLLSLFVALIATTALWASNVITYMATEKLTRSSLNVGATTFGPAITSHTFSNGTGTITCSGEITTIGDWAFGWCSGLTSITIPNSVTSIESYAFDECNKLTSITIPSSVTTIREGAFRGCSGLTSITIPNSVTWIGDCFYYCIGLTSIDVDAANTHYASVDGVLFNYTKDILIQYPIGNTRTEYTIPNSVTTIGDKAFFWCTDLTSITIPNSVTTIGDEAFAECSGLTSITIPNSVTTIGEYAFYYCRGLTSITIPNSVTTIGNSAFGYCSGLTSVTIPNSVTTIGSSAFEGCSDLTSVTLNSNVICSKTYTESNNLCNIFGSQVKEYIIGNSVTTIGDYAFYDCSGLTSVTIGNSVTTIGKSAFANCRYLSDIYCYASVPPIATSSSFANYNVYLYVPCDNLRAYQTDIVFGSFKYIECISAEQQSVTKDEVTIVPSNDNAIFTWPVNPSANGYSLEITKDGVVFCTLKFNAQGQLTGIAFAPSRGGSREMATATLTTNGWQFTVTGLDQASKYDYTLDVLDVSQQSIKHYEGEFYTDGYTGLENLTIDKKVGNKFIYGNQLYLRRGDKIYNAAGVLVK